MITEDAFPVEPWQVRETKLNLNLLAQSESLFALSNGHIGLRGNLDEGEPFGLPGTYLNSFYEIRPLPYAEAGYGYPEAGQTVVDVTNGKIFRLLVGDEPFDVRYGELISHERILDLRAGTLTRRAHWRSPAGKQVKVTSTRLVSLAHRSVAAIEYVVEAIEEFVRVTVQSELVTNPARVLTWTCLGSRVLRTAAPAPSRITFGSSYMQSSRSVCSASGQFPQRTSSHHRWHRRLKQLPREPHHVELEVSLTS